MIITISHQMGTGGPEIGMALAKRLGYRYVDQELISDAARRYGLLEEKLSHHSLHRLDLEPHVIQPPRIGDSSPGPQAAFCGEVVKSLSQLTGAGKRRRRHLGPTAKETSLSPGRSCLPWRAPARRRDDHTR